MLRLGKYCPALGAACLLVLWLQYNSCNSEKISYFSTEHPSITYYNTKYVSYANVSARRHGRNSYMYYMDFHFTTLVEVNNTFLWDFYLYEFLSNTYRKSFVEAHFRTCDLILKDKLIGLALGEAFSCPVPPNTYALTNYSVPPGLVPPGFPFRKGRLYLNITFTPTSELIYSSYVDVEVKEFNRKKQSNGKQRGIYL